MIHHVTVSEIMQLKILKDSPVRAGSLGLSNVVSGITIVEDPDITEWLDGGEVLLTQLYGVKSESLPLQTYFETLARKGVSALMVKTGPSVQVLPGELLEVGEKYHVPVIELSSRARYIDIVTSVMQVLLECKNRHYLDIQNELTTLISSGAQERETAEFLVKYVPARIVVCDDDENIIYDTQKDISVPPFGYRDRIRLPIMCFGKVAGYLKAASEQIFTAEDETILKNAANLMAVTFMKKYYVAEVEQKYANLFLEDLFNGKLDERQIAEKVSNYGWNFSDSYLVATVLLECPPSYVGTYEISIQDVITTLSELLPSFNCLSHVCDDRIHILCHGNTEKTFTEITEHLEQALQNMQNYIDESKVPYVFYAGLSTPACGSAQIPGKIRESSDAIQFSQLFQNGIVRYSELGALRILAPYSRREDLVNMIPNPVKRLADYDEQNNTTYLETLDSLLGNNLNLSKTAKELFIHYKTMLHRMDRICQIAEISLDDRQQRLDIELGVKLYMMLPK